MSSNELISSGTRGRFREIATDHYLGEIDAAFHDEGFAPNPDCELAPRADDNPTVTDVLRRRQRQRQRGETPREWNPHQGG